MFKTLIQIGFILLLTFCFFLSKNAILPTFQLTNSPTIITKGQYGISLIIKTSYSHDGFEEWLQKLNAPYPLFLIDVDWLDRSDALLEIFLEKQIPVGLLGHTNEDYLTDTHLLETELASFEKSFGRLPLWFATKDDLVDTELLQQLFENQINVLASSLDYPATPVDGAFIAINLDRDTIIDFDNVKNYMHASNFISIEENLFGYQISTQRYP